MDHAKALAGFAHAPEETARVDRAILQLRLFALAVIAVAAVLLGIDLAKVTQQSAAATLVALTVDRQLLELLARDHLLFGRLLVKPVLHFHAVAIVQEKNALRGLAVA